ncbi:streptomycin 6-kinase [Sorangium cellulosum]|uniref:Streptomycin 6-kinase n=1 Tax=Sorangium cellulosum TaxID=56 RepID=A0A2L0EKU6_SORCE|nr:aminoglycoside phosphotransferase family protein [Sorangium cellulosum]AUX39927.1 streptomycin 6-kinase [Sorangium cellulosum]
MDQSDEMTTWSVPLVLPPRLVTQAESSPEGRVWLSCLPARVADLLRRWSLELEAPAGDAGATCSFVARVRRADGTKVVLKLGLPHLEAEHEALGLRFWNGDGMARLLDADDDTGALLLERCEPGTPLAARPEEEQDVVIASILRRLWRAPAAPHGFRPLCDMVRYWVDCALARSADWPDAGFARAGIARLIELARPAQGDVLLATDLHAGNVLAAQREPWLAIDPKPFVGDPAYDATQHLLNGTQRLRADPRGTVARLSERLGVSGERVGDWLFARLAQAAHVRGETFGLSAQEAVELARRLEQ